MNARLYGHFAVRCLLCLLLLLASLNGYSMVSHNRDPAYQPAYFSDYMDSIPKNAIIQFTVLPIAGKWPDTLVIDSDLISSVFTGARDSISVKQVKSLDSKSYMIVPFKRAILKNQHVTEFIRIQLTAL